MTTHILERAFQLADSGAVPTPGELRRKLRKEGYVIADIQHIHGASITRQLTQRMKAAQARVARRTEGLS